MFMRRLSALGYRHSAKTNTNDKSEHEGHKGKKQGHETKGKQTTFPILRVLSEYFVTFVFALVFAFPNARSATKMLAGRMLTADRRKPVKPVRVACTAPA